MRSRGFPEQQSLAWAERFFEPSMRSRGRRYFLDNLVEDTERDGWTAEAAVHGKDVYGASLTWDPARADGILRCTCPVYEGGYLCKHAWAFLLKLADEGWPKQFLIKPESRILHEKNQDAPVRGPAASKGGSRWRDELRRIREQEPEAAAEPAGGKIRLGYYFLELGPGLNPERLLVRFGYREELKSGGHGSLRTGAVAAREIPLYREEEDRELLGRLLLYGREAAGTYYYGASIAAAETPFRASVPPASVQGELLRRLAASRRLFLVNGPLEPLSFDDRGDWSLETSLRAVGAGRFRPVGTLVRGAERLPLDPRARFLGDRLFLRGETLCTLSEGAPRPWLLALQTEGESEIPATEVDEWVAAYCEDPRAPRLALPTELGWREAADPVRPVVALQASEADCLPFEVRFRYGHSEFPAGASAPPTITDPAERRLYARDPAAEAAYLAGLRGRPGVDWHEGSEEPFPHGIDRREFVKWADHLLAEGWSVEVAGQPVATPGNLQIRVSSGTDWFGLEANVRFGEASPVELPELLAARRKKQPFVALGDGRVGLLPAEWLDQLEAVADLGDAEAAASELRFALSQGPLLAGWLAGTSAPVESDGRFRALREELTRAEAPEEAKPAPGFAADLRPYQARGLAWLQYLARVGYGGILADDMGLGKTVQVLALLHGIYAEMPADEHRPSLVVLPKSLLFNWREEAHRFAPSLRVHVHAGAERGTLAEAAARHDVVLVTYTTLRLDEEAFRAIPFHYVIADEAQAIKNPTSQAHRVCSALNARRRVALTGTPVENSAVDLLSILDFVSPGLIGKKLRTKLKKKGGRLDEESAAALARTLKPFLLRRTKAQVLPDLPPKTESFLYCELEGEERRRYDELALHLREKVRALMAERSLGQMGFVLLEALLQLRQAACHAALLDPRRAGEESAKLEILLDRLAVLASEGRKALVFSSFTGLLDLVEARLRREGLAYERLDGSVPLGAREARVKRFQGEEGARFFLISLKAGGVGLNLTAADSVFLLDPWWNPAAEAQAIDRSHRIGQENPVHAYRLIAKNTVEEKILELQKSKRDLAAALVSADESLLRRLTPNDVMNLLS